MTDEMDVIDCPRCGEAILVKDGCVLTDHWCYVPTDVALSIELEQADNLRFPEQGEHPARPYPLYRMHHDH